jgi:hypothetical protein
MQLPAVENTIFCSKIVLESRILMFMAIICVYISRQIHINFNFIYTLGIRTSIHSSYAFLMERDTNKHLFVVEAQNIVNFITNNRVQLL